MTDRTTPARKPIRYLDEGRPALATLIADTLIGHVGFVHDDQPYVIPTALALDDDGLILHGSSASGWMRHLADGRPACVTVTALDALVVSRSAFESSMRYRSAVVFGRCTALEREDKIAALDAITDTLIPGRVAEVRGSNRKELAATLVLRMTIEDLTVKANTDAWPADDEMDVATDIWAGVVPRQTTYGEPMPAPDLREGIDLPPSVRGLNGHGS